jgi:hypothetical protein
MTTKNTPAAATVEKIAAQLGAEPRWASQIGPDAGFSAETTRRCLKALEAGGRARRTDDGQWAAIQPESSQEPVPATDTRSEPSGPQSEPQAGPYDVAKADVEWRALKEWKNSGKKGDRPSTANLDAMNAAHAAGQPRSGSNRRNGNGAPRASKRSERGLEAAATSKRLNNHRGRGRKVSDAELDAYIRRVREQFPDARMIDEGQYAYWVEGIAIGMKRWAVAWQAVESGSPVPVPSNEAVAGAVDSALKASDVPAKAAARNRAKQATVTDITAAQSAAERVKARRTRKSAS